MALGKGLSALIPEKIEEQPTSGILNLKVSAIKDNSLQPRTNYDDQKLDQLKESIREKGILQPILVRQVGSSYEVVAGERRLKAARALNLDEIPVVVKELSDRETLVIALIENIQREELNPIEEARAYKKLIEEFSYTQEAVAQSVGKDRTTVTNLLRLLNLPDEIQKAVYDGKITVGHARALLAVASPQQQKILFIETVAKGLSVREIEKRVKQDSVSESNSSQSPSRKDPNVAALENDLQKVFGTKVNVLGTNKKGKVVIEYYSLDDLDRIIEIIRK